MQQSLALGFVLNRIRGAKEDPRWQWQLLIVENGNIIAVREEDQSIQTISYIAWILLSHVILLISLRSQAAVTWTQ